MHMHISTMHAFTHASTNTLKQTHIHSSTCTHTHVHTCTHSQGAQLMVSPLLAVRVGEVVYPWSTAAPLAMGLLLYGTYWPHLVPAGTPSWAPPEFPSFHQVGWGSLKLSCFSSLKAIQMHGCVTRACDLNEARVPSSLVCTQVASDGCLPVCLRAHCSEVRGLSMP
jgi:hypothetical protein